VSSIYYVLAYDIIIVGNETSQYIDEGRVKEVIFAVFLEHYCWLNIYVEKSMF